MTNIHQSRLCKPAQSRTVNPFYFNDLLEIVGLSLHRDVARLGASGFLVRCMADRTVRLP